MHHSNDFKLSAVNHYLKNDNYLQTSELFNCKRTSLMRWVKRYNETGNVLNQPRNTTTNQTQTFSRNSIWKTN
jgi:transposase-like protein